MTDDALETAADAAGGVSRTAGEFVEPGRRAAGRAAKSAARSNRRVAEAEAEVAKVGLRVADSAARAAGGRRKAGRK